MSEPKDATKHAVNLQTLEALLLGTNLTKRDHDILCIATAVRERPSHDIVPAEYMMRLRGDGVMLKQNMKRSLGRNNDIQLLSLHDAINLFTKEVNDRIWSSLDL